MIATEKKEIFVERAEPAGELRLRIFFNDASEKVVDFSGFLTRSTNPLIRAYLDPAAFARYAVKDGDLVWDDYELCFPIADLYEGTI